MQLLQTASMLSDAGPASSTAHTDLSLHWQSGPTKLFAQWNATAATLSNGQCGKALSGRLSGALVLN